jgi:hypothetical protein
MIKLTTNPKLVEAPKMKENEELVRKHIKTLFKKELYTLDWKRPFTVESIQGNLISITTSTGNKRNVPLQGTIDAYNYLQKHGTMTRTEIRDGGYSDWNPAYVAAILASFPGISYTARPIRLSKV